MNWESRRPPRPAIASRLTVVLASLALAGCSPRAETSGPAAGPAAPTFAVVHPQQKMLPKVIEQPGTVQRYETTPLYAKLAGFVSKVQADIGDPVEAGAVLAELSIPELEDEGRQKGALVEQARAEVEQARQQVTIAEATAAAVAAQVAEARAGLTRAEATYKRWESEAARVAEMVKNRVIDPQTGAETENQFRSAEAAREEAKARITVAEKAVVKARAEQGKAGEDVKAAAARQRVTEAEAARLKSLLGYRFIRAPFAGVVTRRAVDTGHFVQPAGAGKGEALFTVVRLDTVRVPVDVPEADAGLIKKGARAAVRVPALKGADLAGTVARTSEALDPGSRTLRVEIDLPNPDRRLRPGMYAYVRLTADMPDAWVLPANAVVKQADQTVVFLHRDGKASRLPVQAGRSDGTWTEVFRKQKAGTPGAWEDWTGQEDVLSGPATGLADGQPVAVGR